MFKIKLIPDLDLDTKITIATIFSFATAIIIYLSIFGLAGVFGDIIGSLIRLFLGRGSFVLPLAFIFSGIILLRIQKTEEFISDINPRLFWGFLLMLVSFNGFLSIVINPKNMNEAENAGGVLGYFIYPVIFGGLGPIAAFVLLLGVFFVGFFFVSNLSLGKFIEILKNLKNDPKQFWDLVPDVFELWKPKPKPVAPAETPKIPETNTKPISKTDPKKLAKDIEIQEIDKILRPDLNTRLESKYSDAPTNTSFEGAKKIADNFSQTSKTDFLVDNSNQQIDKNPKNSPNEDKPDLVSLETPSSTGFDPNKAAKELFDKKEQIARQIEEEVLAKKLLAQSISWDLPQFDILKTGDLKPKPEKIEENKEIIQSTLQNFGISVEMQEVNVGPTVTQYTLKPASGVRLASIDALQRDMALALAAPNIRIEAPIPGKSLVGVEIPNQNKAMVRLRDLVQTHEFVEFKDDLPIAVGKTVNGQDFLYPLSKMPHLLVAGATGAGKSVWINSLLLSLLYKYLPTELELILVDMKRVELKLYDGIPHLLAPVITEPDKAINALKWAVLEMDKRYELLEKWGKRNIKDYNNMASASQSNLDSMPYIVFIIDELGDLMIRAKNEVEPIIARLTQMSRAVGIHLVLGTQRPDTQVITGLIKANVPTRIAFAVASQIDSRVILDVGGAEKLLGQGDGLLISPSHMKPVRFQGPNVEEVEVKKCVLFWRDQSQKYGFSNLKSEVIETPKVEPSVPGLVNSSESNEDVYEKAKQLVISSQKASTSYLQQMLGVGYPKAAKLINQLEAEGIVGPANGVKSRDVYVLPEELD